MRGRAHFYWLSGTALCGVLLALAGCGGGMMRFGAERAAWRHEAEADCLKSGAVKETAAIVRIEPIGGPGICGADYPLKVAELGIGTTALGYADAPRPPGAIPSGSMPQWPVNDTRYAPPPPPPPGAQQPVYQWQPGPPPARTTSAPVSLAPPGSLDDVAVGRPAQGYEPQRDYRASPPHQTYAPRYDPPQYQAPRYEPPRTASPQYEPPRSPRYAPVEADDIPDDAILPDSSRRAPPRQSTRSYDAPIATQPAQQTQRDYHPPSNARPPSGPRYEPPKLGPYRGPITPVKAAVTPPATLACPIVTALDKWVSESVQPAAMRWFNQPVVEIKQISSYSCRGMVGAGGGHISEHAFGNALDVAGFVLADGRKVMVKGGWNGAPEESGFLHDVHGSACNIFSTVLGPGYNVYHYDHIHVDLMRRASGRTPCRPDAISGEVAAARQLQKTKYARRGDPNITGAVDPKKAKAKPRAVAGEDGEFDDPGITGSIKRGNAPPKGMMIAVPGEDGEFDGEDEE
jgi:hypothetical protein